MTADTTPRHKVVYHATLEDIARGDAPSHAKELRGSFPSWGETARGENPPEPEVSTASAPYLRRPSSGGKRKSG